MEVANGVPMEELLREPAYYLKRTGLVADANKLLKDGWGQPYTMEADGLYDVTITSEAWSKYKAKKNRGAPASAQEAR